MNRAFRIALTVLAIVPAIACLAAGNVKLEAGARLVLEFPNLPDTLATMETGQRQPARLTAQLPANYSRDGKFPLFVFLNGGDGGRGNGLPIGRETVGSNDFICVNLTLFKRAPLDTNDIVISMRDFETVSRAYRVMLGKLLKTVPNISPERSALGGFSNGAHTTGVLLAGRDKFILQHFRSFYLLEGGFGPLATNILRLPTMKPYRFLIMRGDQPDDDQPKSKAEREHNLLLARAVELEGQAQSLDFTSLVMKGFGHELPLKYRAVLGCWVRGEKVLEAEKQ
jgi:hypothetical protein